VVRLVTAETVTVRRRLLCRSRARRVAWMAWAAWGKPRPATVAALEGAELDAAVALVAGAVQHGDVAPGQRGQLCLQARLVALDDEQVLGLLVGDEELGVLPLGMHRVSGDDHAGKVQTGQQRAGPGELVGRAVDGQLRQHRTVGVVERGGQVHRAAPRAARAAGPCGHGGLGPWRGVPAGRGTRPVAAPGHHRAGPGLAGPAMIWRQARASVAVMRR